MLLLRSVCLLAVTPPNSTNQVSRLIEGLHYTDCAKASFECAVGSHQHATKCNTSQFFCIFLSKLQSFFVYCAFCGYARSGKTNKRAQGREDNGRSCAVPRCVPMCGVHQGQPPTSHTSSLLCPFVVPFFCVCFFVSVCVSADGADLTDCTFD